MKCISFICIIVLLHKILITRMSPGSYISNGKYNFYFHYKHVYDVTNGKYRCIILSIRNMMMFLRKTVLRIIIVVFECLYVLS